MAVLLDDGRICRMSYSEEIPPPPYTTSIPTPAAPSTSAAKEKR